MKLEEIKVEMNQKSSNKLKVQKQKSSTTPNNKVLLVPTKGPVGAL